MTNSRLFQSICVVTLAGCDASSASPAAESQSAVLQAEELVECGEDRQPECPLQGWMKANLSSHLRNRNWSRLAVSLDHLSEMAPAGYDGWGKLAQDGARAARGGNLEAVRRACKNCHDRHRDAYKTSNRARQLPP